MRCPNCASPLPDGSVFCTNCGADAREPSSTPAAPLDDAGVAKLTRLLREETAGDYEIDRELARGGMGVVYVATEIQLRRRVAIKVLPPALTFGQGAIERFRREARTAAALDHPNIIPIYRVSAGGELLWYSMKLLEGK
ncbi:MAG TPA: protein kinase family protein, partial [Gemmatimonadales bacterium]|nr:protein kinase family protein [Gemmatimonadales bacterium]